MKTELLMCSIFLAAICFYANAQGECGLCGCTECECLKLDISNLENNFPYAYLFISDLFQQKREIAFVTYFMQMEMERIKEMNELIFSLKSNPKKILIIKYRCGFKNML